MEKKWKIKWNNFDKKSSSARLEYVSAQACDLYRCISRETYPSPHLRTLREGLCKTLAQAESMTSLGSGQMRVVSSFDVIFQAIFSLILRYSLHITPYVSHRGILTVAQGWGGASF